MIAVGCACWKMQFVMVPMLMAYFYTYMMGPFMDLLEKRPYGCFGPCGKSGRGPCCHCDWRSTDTQSDSLYKTERRDDRLTPRPAPRQAARRAHRLGGTLRHEDDVHQRLRGNFLCVRASLF